MERVTVADVEPVPTGGDADRRGLSDRLGTTDVAVNQYRLASGERIAGLHGHADQEELFLVVEGELVFETYVPPGESDGADVSTHSEIAIGAGEAIRFAPGEFQSGRAGSDGEAVVYAVGAPRDSEEIRVPLACPDCGHESRRPALADDGETPVLGCPACGSESEATCPECGSTEMLAAIPDGRTEPVGVCRGCGGESGD